jgi:quercetin dioxygenase-like cupin family protein
MKLRASALTTGQRYSARFRLGRARGRRNVATATLVDGALRERAWPARAATMPRDAELVSAREGIYAPGMHNAKGVPDVRVALFGGRGEVRVWSLLDGSAGPFTAILSCELAPAGCVGQHVQQEFPEVVIGLEGDGRATVDGQIRNLGPGDTVFLPLGSVLSIENRSADAALRYLIVKARA